MTSDLPFFQFSASFFICAFAFLAIPCVPFRMLARVTLSLPNFWRIASRAASSLRLFSFLFGIFEEGELFEIVFGKAGYGDTDQAEGLSFPGFAEELFGAAVDFICDIGRIWKFCLV